MKNLAKLAATGLFVSAFALLGSTYAQTSGNTDVQVEILPGQISIGSTGAFDFGDYTVSSSVQTVTGAFTDYFFVDDLKGADSGYYTTLQLSGDLVGPGGASIGATEVYAQVDSTATTLLSGTTNASVVVPAGLLSWSALDSAVTFINRATGVNNGVVGKYGSLPELRVDIPAYQAVGTYIATLVYTLYEN